MSSLCITVTAAAYRSYVCYCLRIIFYIHMRTREGTCLLSLPLQTLQYVQPFPPSIYCVQFIYNPYTPLHISFSFLDGFLATRGNPLSLVHDLTLYISTDKTEDISL